MNIQELLLLLSILIIISNADYLQKYIQNIKLNFNSNKNVEHFSNQNSTNINNNILIYVNSYKNIYHNLSLKKLYNSLIEVENNNYELFKNDMNILDNTYVFTCIENYKPICSLCVCNIKYLKEYLDSQGNTEALINPISNGYFVYHFLIHKNLNNKMNAINYFDKLLNEIYKWVSNPYSYYINELHNSILNRNTQSNFLFSNLFIMNDSIYRNNNIVKGNYILVFGNKLPDYISNNGDIINGNHVIHSKIANILYKNQFVLDWAKSSKLDTRFKKNSDKIHTCSVNLGKKCDNNFSSNDLLKNGNISSFGKFNSKFNTNNIYIKDNYVNDLYKNVDELYPFEYIKSRYLKKNDYNETSYNFINNMTFYIKYIPRKIQLYQSKQVSVSNYEPYNYT